jgi:hypothetical protein
MEQQQQVVEKPSDEEAEDRKNVNASVSSTDSAAALPQTLMAVTNSSSRMTTALEAVAAT